MLNFLFNCTPSSNQRSLGLQGCQTCRNGDHDLKFDHRPKCQVDRKNCQPNHADDGELEIVASKCHDEGYKEEDAETYSVLPFFSFFQSDSSRRNAGNAGKYNPDKDDYDPANMVIPATPADELKAQMRQIEEQLQKLRWASSPHGYHMLELSCDRKAIEHYKEVAHELEEEISRLKKEHQALEENDDEIFEECESMKTLSNAVDAHFDVLEHDEIFEESEAMSSLTNAVEAHINFLERSGLDFKALTANIDAKTDEHFGRSGRCARSISKCSAHASLASASTADPISLAASSVISFPLDQAVGA